MQYANKLTYNIYIEIIFFLISYILSKFNYCL